MAFPSPHVCSVESLALGEPLLGTAPRADVWFGLEVPMPWGKKALEDSGISEEVKAHLNSQTNAIPEARLLLIRQSGNLRNGISFFAALSAANPPVLYHFLLNDYSELLNLNLESIAAQDPEHDGKLIKEPVFFVCTNGRRDQCCALHGPGVFRAVREKFGDAVWESTHHGGHRFAANLLQLPAGLSYGRLRPESAAALARAGLAGDVASDHFRGRSIYSEPLQAAEGLLQQKLGGADAGNLRLVSGVELEENRWRVRFSQNGRSHDIVVQAGVSGQTHVSCGDEKLGPIVSYTLLEQQSA